MISYILEYSREYQLRLSDALLFRSLSIALSEDLFSSIEEFQNPSGTDMIYWGRDRFGRDRRRSGMASAPYADPVVQAAMGIRGVLNHEDAQSEMSRLASQGTGAIVRDASDPAGRLRHLGPGSSLDQVGFRVDRSDPTQLFTVQPDLVNGPIRRFFIVAGVIAAETPVTHDFKERRFQLTRNENLTLQASDIFSPLTPSPKAWRDAQADAALSLLAARPMATGAIDVGMVMDGPAFRGQVQAVTAAPPGAVDTYWADPDAYAVAISMNLKMIEPGLDTGEDPTPSAMERPADVLRKPELKGKVFRKVFR